MQVNTLPGVQSADGGLISPVVGLSLSVPGVDHVVITDSRSILYTYLTYGRIGEQVRGDIENWVTF